MMGDTPTAERRVAFYWRPGCGFCSSLRRKLERAGVTLELHNIWEDPEAAAVVRGAADGNETVPTVGIGGRYLVNPRAHVVLELLEVEPDAAG
jgi:mycoredoxin